MYYHKNLKKFIAITVIIAFIFQSSFFLHSQEKDEDLIQLEKSIDAYLAGQDDSSKIRLERLIGTIKAKGLELEKKDILGKCYLLIGAISEKKGETILAEENYRRAKDEYGVESVPGTNLDDLPLYKKIVKGEIDIETQFQKALDEYNNGQYDNSKSTLEQIIGTIKKEGLEVKRKNILGKCYLLLGAIYEKKGESILAEENYLRAKKEYGVKSIEGIDLESLTIYKKIIKGVKEGIIEGPGKKKKKKFPVLIVVGVVVVAALAALLLGKKKKEKYTLTVTRGEGVDGAPNTSTTTYEEGTTVAYNYSVQTGYKDLVVTLDGVTVSSSGTIPMNKNHTLNASATPLEQYSLTVTKGTGVGGTPDTGTYTYDEGTTAGYNYYTQNGYTNLVVQLDGVTVLSSGTITMNSNHTLTASTSPIGPTVTITSPLNGKTVSGKININVDVQSSINIDRVEFYVDNNRIDTDRDAPYSSRWNTRNVNDGNHTIRVVAVDSGNNTGEDQISVYVNNGGGGCSISVAITDPSNNATVSGTVTLRAATSGSCVVDYVEFRVDNAPIGTDTTEPYTFDWDTTKFLDGSHPIRVVAHATTGETAYAEIKVIVNNLGGNN